MKIFRSIGIVIIVSLLVLFGPLALIYILRNIVEKVFSLNCASNSGGSLPFPNTACGNVFFIISIVYYIWFVIPVPLAVPIGAIIMLSIYFIRKQNIQKIN